ncbi:MAG: tetratricopeptide repeat protein [Thermodesulfobacteriota bacterium]
MSWIRLIVFASLPVILIACSATGKKGTIGQLQNMRLEIKEVKIEGGLVKAMESYQRFLEDTPDSALSPEAIRRLADLKVEKEYGLITTTESEISAPAPAPRPVVGTSTQTTVPVKAPGESEDDFEKRTTSSEPITGTAEDVPTLPEGADDLEKAGPLEAIRLYQKLLNDFPLYERNDQVLYQMSRAYEELGRTTDAMKVMNRLVRDFPHSRYIDEVQFRRAEYFFTYRKYLDAEEAYKSIVDMGVSSYYYQLALFKLGWAFYKQELYEEAMDRFIAMLDYKVSMGYDFKQSEDETERKRMEDTFRVISLAFSYIGGADSVVAYFSRHGKRNYEDRVYDNLGEYYVDKRRYNDATATYNAFVSRNPYHERAPNFHMRVIEINIAGGFPSLVIESKKAFSTNYGLKSEYWQYFEPSARPDVLGYLKTNLMDLANHYHALYQDKRRAKDKPANFSEALRWYRQLLVSFPQDTDTPAINYQVADLLLENLAYAEAAKEYEKTAYGYPTHEKSSTAGYAAVYAHRQYLEIAPAPDRIQVKREIIRSSLKFAETFPEHDKAAIVLGAAVNDLYAMRDHKQALAVGQKLIKNFPAADKDVLRATWLVVAHSSFELLFYNDAEAAYVKVLALLPEDDKTRNALIDNLAVSIYKQGEQANELEDYQAAADHFLRVGLMAPTSKFRPTAEYDGAAALIKLKDWSRAATVLSGFRNTFSGHELQPEVTKKIAFVYREDGRLSLAASEYERIERESRDEKVRREALLLAAELYEEAGNSGQALGVFRRYVGYFPQPVELNLETRNKIAEILKKKNEQNNYLDELRKIVAIDKSAGEARTDLTRYIAGKAALVLAELTFDQFMEIRLIKPFKVNLDKKKEMMKKATRQFSDLLDYEVGEVTAATTFYLAEIYADFSEALLESERPTGLNALEMEQYEMAIEEQAYPFEDKAIAVHQNNLELIPMGIYNKWIDKSLQKLAVFMPARYAKPEKENDLITSPDTYIFEIYRPQPPEPEKDAGGAELEQDTGVTEPEQDTEATEPEQDTGVTEPEQDTEATEPEQDTEATEPEQDTGVTEPEQDTEATEPEQDTEATGPEQDAGATEPEQNTEVTEPEQDTGATEPEQDTEATEPEQDAGVTEPEQDAEATEPEQDAEATEPEQDAEATEPEQDAGATEPEQDTEATEPEQDAEATEPEQDAGATEPEQDTEATEPEQEERGVDDIIGPPDVEAKEGKNAASDGS